MVQYLMSNSRPPFSDWLSQVDRVMVKRVGLDSGSVEDWPWHSDYECGTSPLEAVEAWEEDNLHG